MTLAVRYLAPSTSASEGSSESSPDRNDFDNLPKQHQSLVVVVDDQFTGRKVLEGLIRNLDPTLKVQSFADPREALSYVSTHCPDLILTDYKMPPMNGVEFIRRLRAVPGCKDVPLVVVTVVEERKVRYEALEAGATDFLIRPIDHHECRTRCQNLLELRRHQLLTKNRAKWLEHQVALATRQIRIREQETLLRLAKAGEYRDEGTGNHILRMAHYSRQIAEELTLSSKDCDEIEIVAPMHDIGKIGVPDHILRKPGRLNESELPLMRAHTIIGYEILKDSPSRFLQLGAIIARAHHERFDGTGYPDGKAGEDIPLAARIVAVADVYDALTTVRPYKRAWSNAEATAYITNEAGRQFDPDCARAFLARLDKIREIQYNLRDTGVTTRGLDREEEEEP